MNNEKQNVNVSITGATGSIGVPLTRFLINKGFKVKALVRNKIKADLLPKRTECIFGDINDITAVSKLLEGAKYLFHLAAVTRIDENEPKAVEVYHEANVRGTRTILDAIKISGPVRLIFFSTIAVYGKNSNVILDESSPVKPESLYASSKVKAEGMLLESSRVENIDVVILRFPTVYGSNMQGNYPRMIRALQGKTFIPFGKGENHNPLIHEIDVCNAALIAAEHPSASGQIYNVTDGDNHTIKEIITEICKVLGRKPPILWLPEQIFRVGASIADAVGVRVRKRTNFERLVDTFNADILISSERIQRELGFIPKVSLEQGWRITIEEWRRKGLI